MATHLSIRKPAARLWSIPNATLNSWNMERQNQALDRTLKAICSSVPYGWRSAVLELEVALGSFANRRAIKHRLTNPDTGAVVEEFPEPLFHATTELQTVFSAYEQSWKRATVTLDFDWNGLLRETKASYDYGN